MLAYRRKNRAFIVTVSMLQVIHSYTIILLTLCSQGLKGMCIICTTFTPQIKGKPVHILHIALTQNVNKIYALVSISLRQCVYLVKHCLKKISSAYISFTCTMAHPIGVHTISRNHPKWNISVIPWALVLCLLYICTGLQPSGACVYIRQSICSCGMSEKFSIPIF